MADDDGGGGGGGKESWARTLRARVGGVPLAVPIAGGVLALAWYLHRQSAKAAAAAATQQEQVINPGLTNEQTPWPYMGGPTFITVPQPVTPQASGNPAPAPTPATHNGDVGGTNKGTPPPKPAPPPPPQQHTQTYAVHSGDTLWAIANRYHTTVAKVYAANASTIENTAKSHGYSGSDQGHPGQKGWWIFPGEKLLVPS